MKINEAENLYYIGGVVRDEILGTKSFDIDLTYVGNAIDFAQQLDDTEILKINEPFGTVKIKFNGKEIDIASTRSEIYERAGHLPTVTKIGCSLKEDVLRRDFTINALAKNIKTGEITDYTGGLEDIKNKKLRILHNKSFIDDPTRILRALKFGVRFNFTLDGNTEKLRDEYLKNVNYDMSYKRIKKELTETFNLNSQKAYEEFCDAKIYKLITSDDIKKPEINIENLINKYKSLLNPNDIWLIYTGTIENLENLEATFTRDEQKIINDFRAIRNKELQNDYDIYKTFENLRTESILLYAILKNNKTAEHYLDNLRNIKIEITGKDLSELNIPPSPEYQECFNYILRKKLENKSVDKSSELELAIKFFHDKMKTR